MVGQRGNTGILDFMKLNTSSLKVNKAIRDHQPNKDIILFNFLKFAFLYNQVAPDYNIIQCYQITVRIIYVLHKLRTPYYLSS